MFNYLLSATLCALSLLFTSASDLCGCKGTLFLRHIQEFMSLFCKNLIFFCLVHSDNVLSSTWFPPGPKGCSMDAERVLNGSTYYPEHPFTGSFVYCFFLCYSISLPPFIANSQFFCKDTTNF